MLTIAVVTLEDIDKYKAMCTGAMCTSDDGTVTIYELADKNPSDYNFGASYQILKQEGLVTEEAGESFTASGNGITVTFTREFSENRPSVQYTILEGSDELYQEDYHDAGEIVSEMCGGWVESALRHRKQSPQKKRKSGQALWWRKRPCQKLPFF